MVVYRRQLVDVLEMDGASMVKIGVDAVGSHNGYSFRFYDLGAPALGDELASVSKAVRMGPGELVDFIREMEGE